MADTAFQTMYRKESIAAFEQEESLVRKSVTKEANVNGNTAVFLVAGSGDATAVTRGVNGRIPARADDLTQNSATLQEWHDKVIKTGFNIYASQGDQRKIMQRTTMGVINRKIDQDIITTLDAATQDTGDSAVMTLNLVMHALAILGNNDVPLDGNITMLITPAAYAYLMQAPEFTSVDFTSNKQFDRSLTQFRWAGVNFIVHPNLTGAATGTEKCLMYHRDAIGHACDSENLMTAVGYDDEDDYSFARCSVYMGSKLLQNSGVVVVKHDATGFAAS